jgi:glycosyltransferase involved in cell wall biosynthesis
MRILYIAAVYPVISGQARASKTLMDALQEEKHEVELINLGKESLKHGVDSYSRLITIIKVLFQVWKKRRNNDIIYLSLAESFFGNMRDLAICALCFNSRHKIFVHMLGGTGMRTILSGNGIQQKINKFFLSKIGGVVIEGEMNLEAFKRVISEDKIHIIPNFAEDYLFVDSKEIEAKFKNYDSIQILFLSNLIPGKGYEELADAFISLPEEIKSKVNIVYVGGFESEESEKVFLDKIKDESRISFLGYIDGDKKRELLSQSQVFCLPTYYPFEGQPFSIFEAYAAGCVVITSYHSGIPYVFADKRNGFVVEKKSVPSIQKAIENLITQKESLIDIALNNRKEADEKYRVSIFRKSFLDLFDQFYRNK